MSRKLSIVKKETSPEKLKETRQEIVSLAVEAARSVIRSLVDKAVNKGDVAAARLVLEVAGLAGKGGQIMLLQQFNTVPLMSAEERQVIEKDLGCFED
ncbi:MAG: hypothetical protein AB1556_07565 [Bacillota bacterium]